MNKDTVLVFAAFKTKDKIIAKWAGTRVVGRDILSQTEMFYDKQ